MHLLNILHQTEFSNDLKQLLHSIVQLYKHSFVFQDSEAEVEDCMTPAEVSPMLTYTE